MICRGCFSDALESVIDLGHQPLSNAYLTEQQLNEPEVTYPLHPYICTQCWLMQIDQYETPDNIFEDYAYFSSESQHWLNHCQQYVEQITQRFNIKNVLEVASNDGYMLQYFQQKGIDVQGIDPAANVAQVAIDKGIPTSIDFFGSDTNLGKYDLIIGNNVFAHVPDLYSFCDGLSISLANKGVVTLEFPYLAYLIKDRQFDTIYHEHFSYFSLRAVTTALMKHGLEVFDVEHLSTHGGSLRVYIGHEGAHTHSNRVAQLLAAEKAGGFYDLKLYRTFKEEVQRYKRVFLKRLSDFKDREYAKIYGGAAFNPKSVSIVAYGAPAKGNTLLNYCGVSTEYFDYCVDTTAYKQGKYLPGSHIPVYHPDRLMQTRPDLIYIQPWNWAKEITEKLSYAQEWDAKFLIRTRYV